MNARLLAVVMPGQEAAALDGLRALVATARAEGARVRIACMRPMPLPREDRHGRVVADVDQEMERITRTTVETFTAAVRVFGDVSMECVVRFGVPSQEAKIEAEVFEPNVVAYFGSRREPGTIRLRARLLQWRNGGRTRPWVTPSGQRSAGA